MTTGAARAVSTDATPSGNRRLAGRRSARGFVSAAALAVVVLTGLGSAWSAPVDPALTGTDLVMEARRLMLEQTTPSLATAEEYLREAIVRGEGAAGYELLGDLYRLPQINDPLSALAAYESAIEAGSRNALAKLGRMLALADGVPADPFRAERLLREAVELGDARYAAEWLGDLYAAPGPLYGPELAADAYAIAANAGSDTASLKLATMLFSGREIAADRDRVEELLLLVFSRSGDLRAAELLGDLYRATWRGANLSLSIQYYEMAATGNRTSAMRKLAALLLEPNTEHFNPLRAQILYEQASEQDPLAYEALGDAYLIDGVTRDASRAMQAYTQAVVGGSADAMLKLARLMLDMEEDNQERVNALAFEGAQDATAEQNLVTGIALLNAGRSYLSTGVVNILEAAQKLGAGLDAEALTLSLSQSARVALIQGLLSRIDYVLVVDGIPGPATQRALESFCTQRVGCVPEINSIDLLQLLLTAVRSG